MSLHHDDDDLEGLVNEGFLPFNESQTSFSNLKSLSLINCNVTLKKIDR